MSSLRELLDGYLSTRRALGFKLTAPAKTLDAFGFKLTAPAKTLDAFGFKLTAPAKTLDAFVDWMDAAGEPTIRHDLATAWVSQFSRGTVLERLNYVKQFAEHASWFDSATEIPVLDGRPYGSHRPRPLIFTSNQIDALLAAAGRLTPRVRASAAFVQRVTGQTDDVEGSITATASGSSPKLNATSISARLRSSSVERTSTFRRATRTSPGRASAWRHSDPRPTAVPAPRNAVTASSTASRGTASISTPNVT